jgi:hypothetical protein
LPSILGDSHFFHCLDFFCHNFLRFLKFIGSLKSLAPGQNKNNSESQFSDENCDSSSIQSPLKWPRLTLSWIELSNVRYRKIHNFYSNFYLHCDLYYFAVYVPVKVYLLNLPNNIALSAYINQFAFWQVFVFARTWPKQRWLPMYIFHQSILTTALKYFCLTSSLVSYKDM